MARDISVELSVEGEREFNRQLKEAQSAVKVLGSELKASEAQFKGGEDAQERYANRTRILGDQIEQERIIIERLAKAVETAGNEFGQTDAKTDKYRIALNRARENVAKMEKALSEAEEEMEDLGDESKSAGRKLENGIGDAAEDAADDVSKLAKALQEDLASIKNSSALSAAMDVGGTMMDAAQGLMEFAESTRESRRQFGQLEQNVANAGLDYEYIRGQLTEIKALTGDEDGAFEGISNLIATGFDATQIADAVDLLGGAVTKFPDTLKFENLAESLQETIATGEATGAYAELLGRLGVDVNAFKRDMGNAKTATERQQIALKYLADHGLEDAKTGFEEANASLIAAETASTNMQTALNNLGGAVEPIGTAFTNLATAGITAFTNALNNTGVSEWIAGVIDEFTEAVNIISQEGLEGYAKHEQQEREAEYKERHEAAATVDSEAVARVEELRKQLDEINAEIDAAWLAEEGIKARELEQEQAKLIDEIGKAEQAVTEAAEKAKKQAEETGGEIGDELSGAASETLEESMPEAGTNAVNDLVDAVEEGNDSANTAGQNLGISVANGIDAARGEAVTAAEQTVNQVNSVFARANAAPTPRRSTRSSGTGGGRTPSASPSMTVSLNVDGRSFAKATVPYYNAQMGESLNAIVNA